MKNFVQEFKDFLIKGNAVDLAVGFMFGAAFADIVKSFVDNIIMPPIGWIIGGIDFSKLVINLPKEGTEGATIKYGLFINNLISFVILGFIIFMMLKVINKLKKPAVTADAPAPIPADIALLTEIRDSLKNKRV